MDSFIKKIFDGNFENDELVHAQFQKFSKGEFSGKAGFILKKTAKNYALSTTPEYGNEIVRILAEELGDNKAEVEGALITTIDLSGEYNFDRVQNALGVRKHFVSGEMSGTQMIELQDKFPKAFFALSFKTPTTDYKVKVKAPKTKPSGKGDAKPKIDFCKLKTTNMDIVNNFAFDIDMDVTKKVMVMHDFIIEGLEMPKDETDFAVIREKAKRVGKVVRRITIDEETKTSEASFKA